MSIHRLKGSREIKSFTHIAFTTPFHPLIKRLKALKEVIFLASSGSAFQSLAAWKLKELVPYRELLTLGRLRRFVYLKL